LFLPPTTNDKNNNNKKKTKKKEEKKAKLERETGAQLRLSQASRDPVRVEQQQPNKNIRKEKPTKN